MIQKQPLSYLGQSSFMVDCDKVENFSLGQTNRNLKFSLGKHACCILKTNEERNHPGCYQR